MLKPIATSEQLGKYEVPLTVKEKRIIIQDNAYNNIKKLEKLGFEPIPIRFSQGRLFSGGIHCCTVDVRRNETMESYL